MSYSYFGGHGVVGGLLDGESLGAGRDDERGSIALFDGDDDICDDRHEYDDDGADGNEGLESQDGDAGAAQQSMDVAAAIRAAVAAAMPSIIDNVTRAVAVIQTGGDSRHRHEGMGQQRIAVRRPNGAAAPGPRPSSAPAASASSPFRPPIARPFASAPPHRAVDLIPPPIPPRKPSSGVSHAASTGSGSGAATTRTPDEQAAAQDSPATQAQAFETLRRRNVIDKFDSSSTMPAEMWVAVFEQATTGITGKQRVELLLSYVTKDALRWYAQFVTPHIATYDWAKVRDLFVKKFARLSVQPILAAADRKLRSGETLQTYFDEKTRLLELAEQSQASMIALLTDGVPDSYRTVITANGPKTIDEWIDVAQRFEVSKRRSEPKPVHLTEVVTDRHTEKKRTDDTKKPTSSRDNTPSKPCPRCLDYGFTAHHWVRDCKRQRMSSHDKRTTEPKTVSATAVPLNGGSGPHTA